MVLMQVGRKPFVLGLMLCGILGSAFSEKPKKLNDSHSRIRLPFRPPGQDHKGVEVHYFALQGLGEPIRMILEYSETPYDSVMYFDTKEYKQIAPFGQMPLYKDETMDGYLAQSGAILRSSEDSIAFDIEFCLMGFYSVRRHLGRKLGMAGSTITEMAQIDMLCECAKDILGKRSVIKELSPDWKEPMSKDAEKLKMFLDKAEKLKHSGGVFFTSAGKATVADIYMLHALSSIQQVAEINKFSIWEVLEHPLLAKFVSDLMKEASMKSYFASHRRIPLTEKEAGNGDQYVYLSELPDSYAQHKEEL